MNNNATLIRSACFLFLAVGLGCSLQSAILNDDRSGDAITSDDGAVLPMGGRRTCEKYWKECHDEYESCIDECWERAIYGDTSNCSGLCRDLGWCVTYDEDDANRCARYGYSFEPKVDAHALSVCEHYMAWESGCGHESAPVDCGSWAAVASPELVAMAERIASSPCDVAEPDPPSNPYPTLGGDICVRVDNACSAFECNETWAWTVDVLGGYVSDEVVAAARACADEAGCLNKKACLGSWTDIVWDGVVVGEPPWVAN